MLKNHDAYSSFIIYHLVCVRKHTYSVPLKEFLKLFRCLASSGIHAVFVRLDLLFKALHQERKRRKERIPTSLVWTFGIPQSSSIAIILHLFIDIWYEVFFIKTLIIISISTNIHRPYVCDRLGLYISLVNNSID